MNPAAARPMLALLLCTLAASTSAQDYLPPGHRPEPHGVWALVGAKVVLRPGTVLEGAVIVIRDGQIEAVGTDIAPPPDATVRRLDGCVVYAGLIDAYVMARKPPAGPPPDEESSPRAHGIRFKGVTGEEQDPGQPGPGYELEAITPERRIADTYVPDAKLLESLRELGFAAANMVPATGVLRGTGAFVVLSDVDPVHAVLRADVFQHASFDPGARGKEEDRTYPASVMGAIAALRQTGFDTQHQELELAAAGRDPVARRRVPADPALLALAPALRREARVAFETAGILQVDQAAHVARELGLDFLLVASGQEWRRPDLVRAAGVPLLVPLKFPELPKLPEDADWDQVSLDQLRAWDWAPENPAILRGLGLEIALTTHGLDDRKDFRKNLKLAIARGLSETDALAALTVIPAALCGVDRRLGTIEAGKIANLTIVEGAGYFDPEAPVREVWIDGRVLPVNPGRKPEKKEKPAEAGAEKPPEAGGKAPEAGAAEPALTASDVPRRDPPGGDVARTGDPGPAGPEPTAAAARKLRESRTARSPQEGRGPLLAPPAVLVQGATIWTCGPMGTLEGADLLCVGGRVAAVGRDLALPDDAPAGIVVIDGRGLHVTPGLIDCHSHAMVVGDVNEGTIPSSAMVRIQDVVNSETENIHRQLAGGLTACNLLHGSANPIGGQNCVIKLREGATPDGLEFAGAPPGIKFALGENVKQANWGEKFVTRFPQSRMGVRTFFANRFEAARQYLEAWAGWEHARAASPDAAPVPPRRDLELEALGEVLRGERRIHCHSYRADEILMLIRLMDSLGVRIGTFQHVLEGYKVADEIAAHGAGGSCFTDWWAYKLEVYDAIPYAGSLMHARGVTVSFNSDSAELARRLNLEAAKAVKYGGTPEPEALCFVTLHPARQLGIDARVGSLEPGKDADFAIWSRSPLDAATLCRQTWIDGKQYFDLARVPERAEARRLEREALLEKARKVVKGGGGDADGAKAAASGFFDRALELRFDDRDVNCMGACDHGVEARR